LNPGSKLQIAMAWQEEIRLRPLPENGDKITSQEAANEAETAKLIWKNGVLMVKAEPVDEATQYAIDHAVELDREARMRILMGDTSAQISDSEPRLIEENGLLVLDAGEGLDILKLIEQDREERIQKLMGEVRI
ncbi:MAG: hypothetical protein M3X11_21320, partial [Acidobacteriota bacterium]|nr:hypothetical protein [Acidobacteriota bacterium]